jgi:hypothetical protein
MWGSPATRWRQRSPVDSVDVLVIQDLDDLKISNIDVLWWPYSVHQWQLRAKQISRRIIKHMFECKYKSFFFRDYNDKLFSNVGRLSIDIVDSSHQLGMDISLIPGGWLNWFWVGLYYHMY